MATGDFLDELLGGWEAGEAVPTPAAEPQSVPQRPAQTAAPKTAAPKAAAPKLTVPKAATPKAAAPKAAAPKAAAPKLAASKTAAPKAAAPKIAAPGAATPKIAAPKIAAPKIAAPKAAAPKAAEALKAAALAATSGAVAPAEPAPITADRAGPLALQAGGGAVARLGQLAPLRANDPLALGAPRAPPPPDPEPYDEAREEREYARSLLSAEERTALREEIRERGFMRIEEVRDLIGQNTAKVARAAEGEACLLDPEVIILVDTRVDYKIFVAGDNVYTREELYAAYPFQEFGIPPEAVFAQQEIGIFPAKKYALAAEELEYVARDVGDETVDFVMLEDLVGRAARATHADGRRPLKIVKTKVFLGKERWDDFAALHRVTRSILRVSQVRQLAGGSGGGLLALLAGPEAPAEPSTSELREREAALRRREAEQREREAAQREREAAQRAREEETNHRIAADLRRIEALLRAAEASRNGRHPKAPPAAPPAGGEEADSVPLF